MIGATAKQRTDDLVGGRTRGHGRRGGAVGADRRRVGTEQRAEPDQRVGLGVQRARLDAVALAGEDRVDELGVAQGQPTQPFPVVCHARPPSPWRRRVAARR